MSPQPIDRLVKAVDELERETRTTERRLYWEKSNRLGLLWVHAFIGLGAGLLMLTAGGPLSLEVAGVWVRVVLGALALTGSGLLAYGLRTFPWRKDRSLNHEAVGLALLALWDVLMAVGFVLALLHTPGSPTWIFPPWSADVIGPQRPYPIIVYSGLFALISIHLSTLRQLGKDRKSGTSP